jgi:phenylpropionate dioxygenase-like ring-hydroxylating dioxygenase large terminal subunit
MSADLDVDVDVGKLVEPDRVHRSIYTDPTIFQLEMERIFEHTWIYVGHDSQVPDPGDYYATVIGRQPVIMVRHKDNKVKVLYNRCAHKGAMLVGDTCGNVQQFNCGYHGWCYDTDGSLKSIPLEKGYDGTRFDRNDPQSSMRSVARVGSYRGFVFASLSPDGPALEEWLVGVDASIDNLADRAPAGELEITGGVLRYMHDSNWKLFVENLNDLMHPMKVHRSSSMTARTTAKKMLSKDAPVPAAIEILAPFSGGYSFFDTMGLHAFDYGHSYSGGKVSIHSAYSDIPDYVEAMESAYGPERTQDIFSENRHNTIFYPSLTIKGAIQSIRVVRPIAVDRTLIESWTFRLKGAPDALLQRSILYCNLINSSANLVGPEDYEAYHRQQHGLSSQGSDWVLMHRNFGQERDLDNGERAANGTSDLAFRNQYLAWKNYMTATIS